MKKTDQGVNARATVMKAMRGGDESKEYRDYMVAKLGFYERMKFKY